MPEHLMSVRFDAETLDLLRTLADIHDSNVAEEVRVAVARYITEVRSDGSFRRQVEEATAARQQRINQLLGV
jgi:hypothetical protein